MADGSTARAAIINSLEETADWRERLSPGDERRNLEAVEILRATAEYVSGLGDDDLRLAAFKAARDPEEGYANLYWGRDNQIGDVLESVGFGRGYPDPETLFGWLAETAREIAEAEPYR